jgi:O-succinylbenzoic acid--CoA ligase
VTTYGSAETCGGCVYDGEPLDGVEVRIGEGELEGRILLGGDTVAAGYLDAARASKAVFFEEDETSAGMSPAISGNCPTTASSPCWAAPMT